MKDFLNSLLKIENDPSLLEYRFQTDNIIIWPMIRHMIFQEGINQKMNFETLAVRKSNRSVSKVLKYFWHSLIHRPGRFRKKYPILIFSTSRFNTSQIKGRYFNYLHDYMADLFPADTLILEDAYQNRFHFPRYFPQTAAHDTLRLPGLILSRLTKISHRDNEQINALIRFIQANLAVPLSGHFYNQVRSQLQKLAVRLPFYKKAYQRLIRRTQCKVLLLNCASYGYESYLTKWAHDAGVIVAEMQHGTISHSHPSYQYSSQIIKKKEFQACYPDYLLTLGNYWNRHVKGPFETYTIGMPHFHEAVKSRMTHKEHAKNTLLIISQWTISQVLIDFTIKLSKELERSGIEIEYRLHPAEVKQSDRFTGLQSLPNVTVSASGDLYEALARCRAVMSVYSTALFEAQAAGIPVYVLRHPASEMHIQEDIGIWINSSRELSQILLNLKEGALEKTYSPDLFGDQGRENYTSFIKRFL